MQILNLFVSGSFPGSRKTKTIIIHGIDSDDKVSKIKEEIDKRYNRYSLNLQFMSLQIGGKEMINSKLVKDYGIENDTTLSFNFRSHPVGYEKERTSHYNSGEIQNNA